AYGYNKQKFNLDGQLLHAYRLTFIHPTTGEETSFCAPVPQYFVSTYDALAKRSGQPTFSEVIKFV
ncbi:MAG: hypothetical protein IKC64_03620, partial [Clostridia bacterium]|nr:hypothetical protein [Clostridia bacterium]